MGNMIGLMMAGGRGSRMHSFHEKLMLGGRMPVAMRVASALGSCPAVTRMVAAVSPASPQTMKMLAGRLDVIRTPGDGYSADLAYALRRLAGPVLVVPADLPLLDNHVLGCVADLYDDRYWTVITVSERYAAMLGLSLGIPVHETPHRYTGVSLVDADHTRAPTRHVVMNDYRLAANMNTAHDWALLGAAQYLAEYFGL